MTIQIDTGPAREDRLHPTQRDQRSEFQRDRDRILYTSAFRRLAGVSQVVGAYEGHVFHNRLTHTLEVAQIARRLAEKLVAEERDLAQSLGGVDPDVCEAAALAHDLGHPPFGHVAEEELDDNATRLGVLDGFEGNPQSFRVVTKLATRDRIDPGLNLTRATLDAILKYPWMRQTGGGHRQRKYGAYWTEADEFEWARALHPADDDWKSAEADIMDWADDVAYAVHDLEDFYRAGLIPLERLMMKDPAERQRFAEEVFNQWAAKDIPVPYPSHDLQLKFDDLMDLLRRPALLEPYSGKRAQRGALRSMTSFLIQRYVNGVQLREPDGNHRRLQREPDADMEIRMLKQLTWVYVIWRPSLASQQEGQRRVIRELFVMYRNVMEEGARRDILPIGVREQLDSVHTDTDEDQNIARTRLAIDIVCAMSEQEALDMHQRLTGAVLGSVLDALPR